MNKSFDLPVEAYLERFLSNVKNYSKTGTKADRPGRSIYQVIGDYQQGWLEVESTNRYSRDLRDLDGNDLKALMKSEDYRAIEARGNTWISEHADQISNFM